MTTEQLEPADAGLGEPATARQSPRNKYLFETLRFNHDPFLTPSAELELQINPTDPPLSKYFVDPDYITINGKSGHETDGLLLDRIQEPGAAFIFAGRGGGKSMLRYMLEEQFRLQPLPRRTLVISLALGKEGAQSNITPATLWDALNQALGIDLFIQVLEQFNVQQPRLTEEELQDLSRYWKKAIPNFERTLRRQLQSEVQGYPHGLSKWWLVWDRPIVYYKPLTAEIRAFVERLLAAKRSPEAQAPDAAELLFDQGIEWARRFGFQAFYLLIDVEGSAAFSQRQIDDLLDLANGLTVRYDTLSPKFFLSTRFQTPILSSLDSQNLRAGVFMAIIQWRKAEQFWKLIDERFVAASNWLRQFSTIAHAEVVAGIGRLLAEGWNWSPRRALQLVSRLIDSHAASPEIGAVLITSTDWRQWWDKWGARIEGSLTKGSRVPFMPNGGRLRDIFSGVKFVGRAADINAIQSWARGAERVCVLTGPPGIGKSWLLQKMLAEFRKEGRQAYLLKVPILDNELHFSQIGPSIHELLDETRKNCPGAPHYDPAVETSALIEQVAHFLCLKCDAGATDIFLLIDEGDLLDDNAWRTYEKQLIEPFLTSTCFRFIVTMRNGQRIGLRKLRKSQLTVELRPFSSQEGEWFAEDGLKQLGKLNVEAEEAAEFAQQIGQQLGVDNYNWSHPCINSILLRVARSNPAQPGEEFNIVHHVLTGLDQLPPGQQDVAELIPLLCYFSHVNNFQIANVKSYFLEKRQLNLPEAAAWDWIERLSTRLLIQHVAGLDYQVVNGLRQFLQAACDQALIPDA